MCELPHNRVYRNPIDVRGLPPVRLCRRLRPEPYHGWIPDRVHAMPYNIVVGARQSRSQPDTIPVDWRTCERHVRELSYEWLHGDSINMRRVSRE